MLTKEQEYGQYLKDVLEPGFTLPELVTGAQNKRMPPRSMWEGIREPLQFANQLRHNMMAEGARGLLCVAAYRPEGGAAASMHKKNKALDLDLYPKDYYLATAFAREAVWLFCSWGHRMSLGLGLYGRPGSLKTLRVHIDCGKHAEEDRGWQIYGHRELGLKASDITKIAKWHGFVLP